MPALVLSKSQVLSASMQCAMSFWEKNSGFIPRLKYSVMSGSLSSRSVNMSSKSATVNKEQRDRRSSPLNKEQRDRRSSPLNEEQRDRRSSPLNKEQRDRRSSPLNKEQRDRRSSRFNTRPRGRQMKNDKIVDRAQIYEFLRGIGIIPDELDGLELPVTVEVMRERINFLHKLGLTIEDINQYPLVLGCSVKKNLIPVLDYLGKLGVQKAQLADFLRRYPRVLHSSVVMDLEPVVKYLQGMGIKPIDIPHVLVKYPEVLGFKLDGTMSTSVAYLVGIGVSRREVGAVYTRYPDILGMRVGRVIKPFVEYLESVGIPSLTTAALIERWPHILGFGLDETVKPNVKSLLVYNVKETSISSVINWYPDILGIVNLDMKLHDQKNFLDSLFGLNAEDFGRVIERIPQIVSLSNRATIEHVKFLQQCGLLDEQVSKMVVRCPQLLALNLDIMALSFDYFKNTMKRQLDELVDFPAFFTYSLESTVKYRHEMIIKKGLKCSLRWLLSCMDERFEERMSYGLIDMEEMEGENSSFDMDSLVKPRTRSDDESALDSEEDYETVSDSEEDYGSASDSEDDDESASDSSYV